MKKLVYNYTRINGVEQKRLDPLFANQHGLSININFHKALGIDVINSKPYSGKSGIIAKHQSK